MNMRCNLSIVGGILLGLATAMLVTGCSGSDGPERYSLEGSVTYGGKPVPGGQIAFEPDGTKGNRGPASYATISDGAFATDKGKGTVGGPHIVRILGTDGKPNAESPQGNMLFSSYETTADLPKEDATQDFDIPASHR